MAPCYFFGCWREVGHYLHLPGGDTVWLAGPWSAALLDDDRWLPPDRDVQRQGVEALHHADGWTLLAQWDRTVDRRPGSVAIFLAPGTLDADAMRALAALNFPHVAARLAGRMGCEGAA